MNPCKVMLTYADENNNKKSMKKIALLTLLLGSTLLGKSQQDPMLSQYMFNGLFINPAYAGSHPYFSSSLLYRTQWVGMGGSPQTQLVAVDGPIANDKLGIGMIISHDKIGVTNQTDIYPNVAYRIKMDKNTLSFGLRAGVSHYSASVTELKYWDEGDPIYQNNIRGKWIPKFGFGAYFYSERYYVGLSIPTLLAYDSNYNFGINVETASFLRRHYLLTGGYVFDLNENLKLKPSVLFKYVPSAPFQADINATLGIKDALWVGASFRTGDAVIGIIEYQANNRFRVGYAYDYTVTALNNYSNGTHEIMFGVDFGKEVMKSKTPRFF